MSDNLKSMFKAAKAQRGSTVPTKEQLRALKAQKAAAAAAAAQQEQQKQKSMAMPPPAPRQPSAPSTAAASSQQSASFHSDSQEAQRTIDRSASVTSTAHISGAGASTNASRRGPRTPHPGFFDTSSSTSTAAATSRPAAAAAAPAGLFESASNTPQHAAASGEEQLPAGFFERSSAPTAAMEESEPVAGAGAVPEGFFEAAPQVAAPDAAAQLQDALQEMAPALPKGFFQDKEADLKARGQPPPPKKKDIAAEYKDFEKAIAPALVQVELREDDEAEAAAQERAEREAFEQRMRIQRVEELKERAKATAAKEAVAGEHRETNGTAAPEAKPPPAKRRRMQQPVSGDDEDEDDDDDDSSDDDLAVNWRAKRL